MVTEPKMKPEVAAVFEGVAMPKAVAMPKVVAVFEVVAGSVAKSNVKSTRGLCARGGKHDERYGHSGKDPEDCASHDRSPVGLGPCAAGPDQIRSRAGGRSVSVPSI
jgi:hypothetical protein